MEQRYRHHVRTVQAGGRRPVHAGVLRTAGAASGALDATDTQLPRRAMERERSSPRRTHQQTWRSASLQVSICPVIRVISPQPLMAFLHTYSYTSPNYIITGHCHILLLYTCDFRIFFPCIAIIVVIGLL